MDPHHRSPLLRRHITRKMEELEERIPTLEMPFDEELLMEEEEEAEIEEEVDPLWDRNFYIDRMQELERKRDHLGHEILKIMKARADVQKYIHDTDEVAEEIKRQQTGPVDRHTRRKIQKFEDNRRNSKEIFSDLQDKITRLRESHKVLDKRRKVVEAIVDSLDVYDFE